MIRDVQPVLTDMLADRSRHEVILVEGARQVGKSYLVAEVLSALDRPVVAIDLEKNRRMAWLIEKTRSFEDFRALMTDQAGLVEDGGILFIDEAQECPLLATYIKSFKEDWPGVKVILTGSSMNRLFSKSSRIPVGRTRSIRVFPFSFSEFLRCLGHAELADWIHQAPDSAPPSRHEFLLRLYDRYLRVGGYPEAVKALAADQPAEEIIDEIIGTLKDDFALKEDYEPDLFEHTLCAVANHLGSPSKYTHWDTTKYRARQIINAMKAWHLILEVRPEAIDPLHSDFLPKRYLHDLGVIQRCRSLAIPSISLLNSLDAPLRQPLGGLFENAVLLGLLEGTSARKQVGTWRKSTKSTMEVDFVLSSGQDINIPIECKAALTVRRRHADSIAEYLRAIGQSFGVVVSAAPLGLVWEEKGLRVLNVPVYLARKENLLRYSRDSFVSA